MRRRPWCLLFCAVLPAAALLFRLRPPAALDPGIFGKAAVIGEISYREERANSRIYYLKDACVSGRPERAYLNQILVYASKESCYPIGTIVKTEGTIEPFLPARNPGQFDERTYYAGKGISAKCFADTVSVLGYPEGFWERGGAAVREWLISGREMLADRLSALFAQRAAGILQAMLFGISVHVPEDAERAWAVLGIGHLLAISGLHVTMLGGGLYRALRRLGLPYGLCAAFGGVLLAGYGEMLGFRVSAVRAVGMFLLFLLAQAAGRSYDRLTALSILGLAVLGRYPYQLCASGFQLSFLAAGAAAAALEYMEEGKRIRRERRYARSASEAGGRAETDEGGCLHRAAELLFVPLVIQAATLPVLAWTYGELSVYSLLWNVLLVPMAGVLLLSGLLALGLSFLSWPLGMAAGGAAEAVLWLYDLAGAAGQRLPQAVYVCGRPEAWQIACYYGALLLAAAVFWPGAGRQGPLSGGLRVKKSGRRLRRGSAALYVLSLALLVFVRFHAPVEVTFLDVGQGDCAVIRQDGGLCMLVDGGSTDVGQVGKYRMIPFLKQEKIPCLDYVFVSHGDADHISGVLELLESGEISVGHLAIYGGGSGKLEKLREAAAARGIPVEEFWAGRTLETDSVRVRCLGPPREAGEAEENDQSLILRLEAEGIRFLFTGDAQTAGEKAALTFLGEEGKKRLRADILKAGHHGAASSTSWEFLAAVSPAAAVISCGEGNSYGHPSQETLKRLAQAGVRVYVTKDCGAVKIRCRKGRAEAETCLP